MEADSTTCEQDMESSDCDKRRREIEFVNELSRKNEFFRQTILPMLSPGHEGELLEWMKEFSLIPNLLTCPRTRAGCASLAPTWVTAKVVDKYQWKCTKCTGSTAIREKSFFKNIHVPLSTILIVFLAWCQDVDYEVLANILGKKVQAIMGIFDKIEKIISSRPLKKLGGPNNVIMLELYPDFTEELYPVSSKDDAILKPQHKILCIASTNEVPTRYLLHVITKTQLVPLENNNSKFKKLDTCQEIIDIIKKNTIPGGFCAIGNGATLEKVGNCLKSLDFFQGITSMNNIEAHSSNEMQSFLKNRIWKPIVTLCEAAHDLPKNKMQSYLSCSLWRQEVESSDSFLSLIRLISEQDYNYGRLDLKIDE